MGRLNMKTDQIKTLTKKETFSINGGAIPRLGGPLYYFSLMQDGWNLGRWVGKQFKS